MSQAIGTPVNQVRLTNVAYVRLKRGGKWFLLACYKNKVMNWRGKVETDLDEVLQTDVIFRDVSKGMLASKKDIVECFGTDDRRLVTTTILEKGELQVSETERNAQIESVFRDVASLVASKTVNPQNNRPYTQSMIQDAMHKIHFGVNLTRSSKQQALMVIRQLKEVMPIAKAKMVLRIMLPADPTELVESLASQVC